MLSRIREGNYRQAKRGGPLNRRQLLSTNNLDLWISRYKNIIIALWLGTCDLTKKTGKYIDLQAETSVDSVIEEYRKIASHIKEKHGENAKVIVLEVPYYSIEIWKPKQGSIVLGKFSKEQQTTLRRK